MRLKNNVIQKYSYPLILLLITVISFILIEYKYPYFFLQDDNRDFHLPNIVHNIKAIMNFEFPLFNFHQYLGSPHLASAQTEAFYPPAYIAAFFSRVFLGHYLGTMDFLSFIHVFLALLGFFYLMQNFGLSKKISMFGAIAWAFNSYIFYIGNSWIHIILFAAYLPWHLLFLMKFFRKPDIRNFVVLCLIKTIMFYLDYPQYFVYCITFEFFMFVYYLAFIKKSTKTLVGVSKDIGVYILNYFCVLLLVLPLLLPTWNQMTMSASRQQALIWTMYIEHSLNFYDFLLSLFNPFVNSGFDKSFINQYSIYHIGLLTVMLALLSVLFIFKKTKHFKIKLLRMSSILFVFSLLWSSNFFITNFFYNIPIFNSFRWPFKIAIFSLFFLVISGTIGFDLFYKMVRGKGYFKKVNKSFLLNILIILNITNFLVLYVATPQKMLGVHLDKVPFNEPLQKELSDGRIASFNFVFKAPKTSVGLYGNTVPSLGFNYATLFGLYHFGGSGPMVLATNNIASLGLNYTSVFNFKYSSPLDLSSTSISKLHEYLSHWGVKWYIFGKNTILLNNTYNLERKYSDENRDIYFNPNALPMVYWKESKTAEYIEYKFNTNSIDIKTNNPVGSELCVNVLQNSFFQLYVNNVEETLRLEEFGHMGVTLPSGVNNIRIIYKDPYFTFGVIISLIFFVLSIVGLVIFVRKNKK